MLRFLLGLIFQGQSGAQIYGDSAFCCDFPWSSPPDGGPLNNDGGTPENTG